MWGNTITLGDEVTFRIGKSILTGKIKELKEEYVDTSVDGIGNFRLRNIDVSKVKK